MNCIKTYIKAAGLGRKVKRLVCVQVFVMFLFSVHAAFTITAQGMASPELTFHLNTPHLKFFVKAGLKPDGTAEALMPPALQLLFTSPPESSFKYTITAGQIRPAGLFSLMLNPMGISSMPKTIRLFSLVSKPDTTQKYSGIGVITKYVNAFALTPILSPSSPAGIGVSGGGAGLRGAVVVMSQADKTRSGNSAAWQPDWADFVSGRLTVYSIISTSVKTEMLTVFTGTPVLLSADCYVTNQMDINSKPQTVTAVKVSAEYRNMTISWLNRNGSYKDRRFVLTVGDDTGAELTVRTATYPPPIYGGHSQRRIVEYSAVLMADRLHLKSTGTLEYEEDTGTSLKTVYELKFHTLPTETADLSVNISTTLEGTKGKPASFSSPKLTVTAGSCKMGISASGKVTMKLSLEREIKNGTLTVSLNQDRELTLKLTLNT